MVGGEAAIRTVGVPGMGDYLEVKVLYGPW